MKNWLAQYGGVNIALHLGRSRMAVLVQTGYPGMTVQTPYGAGHWWYDLPEGIEPEPQEGPGWRLLAGDRHVLVPPSSLGDGNDYRLVGGTLPAPEWMVGR